jgi:hypothetical protein
MHSGFGSASSSIAMIWFVPSGSGLMYGVKLGCQRIATPPYPLMRSEWLIHTIVLGGDFNASLHREPPNNIDKMLRDCCSEAGLTTPDNYPVKPTFYHHDNKSSSEIDYLFTLKDRMCRLSLSTFGRHIYSTSVSYIMLLLASF